MKYTIFAHFGPKTAPMSPQWVKWDSKNRSGCMLAVHSSFQDVFSLFEFGFEAHLCRYVGKLHHFWSYSPKTAPVSPRWVRWDSKNWSGGMLSVPFNSLSFFLLLKFGFKALKCQQIGRIHQFCSFWPKNSPGESPVSKVRFQKFMWRYVKCLLQLPKFLPIT